MTKFAGNIHADDVFLYNDPYKSDGGITHLGDMCITRAVFSGDEIVAYVQVFGHVNDIGGMTPGSVPLAAFEIFQEGFVVPPVKLYDQGQLNVGLFETILNNSRFPDDLRADIDAFVNACGIGVVRVQELCERYGSEALAQTFTGLLERCTRSLRETVLPMIPDGSYTFEDFCEYVDVQPREPRHYVKLRATMTKTPDGINFDFTGTDPQIKGSLNWPANGRYYAKSLGTLFLAFAPDMIINDGVNEVITCTLPERTVLSPEWPAACGWRTFPLLRILDLGLGILAKASGGFVPAPSESISSYGLYGNNADGDYFLLREITGAGSGARPFADGADTVDVAPESRNMPAEFAESNFPVRIARLGLRLDSGGAGTFRGGLGYFKDIEILIDGELLIHSDRATLQPWGVKGGRGRQGFGLAPEPRHARRDRPAGQVRLDSRPQGRRAAGAQPRWWRLGRPPGPRPCRSAARRAARPGVQAECPGRLRRRVPADRRRLRARTGRRCHAGPQGCDPRRAATAQAVRPRRELLQARRGGEDHPDE